MCISRCIKETEIMKYLEINILNTKNKFTSILEILWVQLAECRTGVFQQSI